MFVWARWCAGSAPRGGRRWKTSVDAPDGFFHHRAGFAVVLDAFAGGWPVARRILRADSAPRLLAILQKLVVVRRCLWCNPSGPHLKTPPVGCQELPVGSRFLQHQRSEFQLRGRIQRDRNAATPTSRESGVVMRAVISRKLAVPVAEKPCPCGADSRLSRASWLETPYPAATSCKKWLASVVS